MPPCFPHALLCIALDPVLCILLKLLAVLAVLIGDGGLDGIIGVGFNQKRLDQAQNGHDLVWRLPFVGTKQAQTHGTLVIVAHVGVVDFGSEADNRWLEGIFVRKGDFELKVPALCAIRNRLIPFTGSVKNLQTYRVDGLIWTVHENLPLGHVLFIKVDLHA
jgi:hypothetical protein